MTELYLYSICNQILLALCGFLQALFETLKALVADLNGMFISTILYEPV